MADVRASSLAVRELDASNDGGSGGPGSTGWLVGGIGAGAVCLAIAYLSALPRGPYADDYLAAGFRLALGPRAVGIVVDELLSSGLAHFQLAVHVALALLVGFNAILLGGLVLRVSRSRLAALAAGWLFVAPPWAFEATLWVSASHYLLGTTLLLIYLHLTWEGRPRHAARRFAITAATLVLALLTAEQAMVVAFASAPFLHALRRKEGAKRLLADLWGPLLLASLAGVMVYFGPLAEGWGSGRAISTAARGGIDLDPSALVDHSVQFMSRFVWMTASRDWGTALFGSALATAWDTTIRAPSGLVLLLLTALAVVLTARAWLVAKDSRRASFATGAIAVAWAAVWAAIPVLLPGILLRNQQLEYRMLYIPSAGAAAGIAFLASRLLESGSHRVVQMAVVVSAGAAMVVSSLTVAGFGRAFQVRSVRDSQEVKMMSSLPASVLPIKAFIVPLATEPSLASAPSTLDNLLAGGLEAPWSSRVLIDRALHRPDLTPVTMNRWTGMRFDYVGADQVSVQGENAPLDSVLVFTFDRSTLVVIDKLLIQSTSGTVSLVAFPVGERMASMGIPAETVRVVPGAPVFAVTRAR